MTKLTKKRYVERYYDTPLGKALGWLAHEECFWRCEIDADKWLLFVPVINVLGICLTCWLREIIIKIFQAHYDSRYQKAYNNGADKGNQMYYTAMGWIDTTKKTLTNNINSVKATLDDAIEQANSKIKTLDKYIADFNNKMSAFNYKINDATTKVNNMLSELDRFKNDAKAKFDNFTYNISQFDSKLRSYEQTAKTNFDNFNNTLSAFNSKLKQLESRVRELEVKANIPPSEPSLIERWKRALGL